MNRRILLVDDDIGMVETLRDILSLHGWEVTPADSGEAAVAAHLESDFDVVLMDLKMPGMDGVTASRKMRERNPELPVIIMTAHDTAHLQRNAEQEGLRAVLRKPIDLTQLIPMLNAGM